MPGHDLRPFTILGYHMVPEEDGTMVEQVGLTTSSNGLPASELNFQAACDQVDQKILTRAEMVCQAAPELNRVYPIMASTPAEPPPAA